MRCKRKRYVQLLGHALKDKGIFPHIPLFPLPTVGMKHVGEPFWTMHMKVKFYG
jgi:hypothetical protein